MISLLHECKKVLLTGAAEVTFDFIHMNAREGSMYGCCRGNIEFKLELKKKSSSETILTK